MEKDTTGTVIASSEASRETSDSGTITEKSNTSNQDGSTESDRVTEQTGDYTFNEVKKDTTGSITETMLVFGSYASPARICTMLFSSVMTGERTSLTVNTFSY